ncbi:MAG: methyltransferase domain-containing protein [Planctomycetaceae bacterium]|nr:methyltransferase domain-containing protein [Planctomycetaceae bacterium]
MLNQSLKDIYFLMNRFACLPNTALARLRYSKPQDPEGHYLHLGCGDDYKEGMINVDGNIRRKADLWLDLRNNLPFRDGSARLIYCSHTLEHLLPYEALALLKEMRRVVAPDGCVRLAVPSLQHALNILAGTKTSHWPRQFDDPASQAINYIFCDGQHKYAYCFPLLKTFALEAGFTQVLDYSAEHGETPKQYGRITVGKEPPGSLIVELRR